MGRRKMLDSSNGKGVLSELFDNQRKRMYTLSVDEEAYTMITRVAEQLGRSRPKVLTAFVKSAYDTFVSEAKSAGVRFNPDATLTGNHKGSRDNPAKKKSK